MDANVKRVLVCSAWPYASGILHLGNLVGCLLSGCVFKRFYRLRGFDALHVSGTDAHGTHIDFEASRQGTTPAELAQRVHEEIVRLLQAFEVDIDNYTITESPVHLEFVTEIYRQMDAAGYIISQEEERAYCQGCQRFLADRYIIGTCPRCGDQAAKGNQCDACGRLLEPEELSDAACAWCGSRDVVRRSTRHWYLDLARLEPQLKEYVRSRSFRGNVAEFTRRMLDDGLRPRAVTRDIEWGIPAPFPGAEGKVIYVWAEAALGYVSATIEHFSNAGQPERWKDYWFGDEVWQVYTQGKDNIPFHTVVFPGQLIASERGYHLPDQISASEYLNWVGGEQFSKSRGVGIYADEAIQLLPPVYWRFYLLYNRPEGRDSSFSWEEFDKAVNGILVDNIANFVHRVLSFVWSQHDGVIPNETTDPEVEQGIEETLQEMVSVLESGAVAGALRKVAMLAVQGNEFFQRRAPWRGGDTVAVASAAHLVKALAILLEPFIPMFSRDVYRLLKLERPLYEDATRSAAGTELASQPQPLVARVDVEDLKERYRMMKEEGLVDIEEFKRLDLRVGKIALAEEVPGADKIYRLEIDVGDRRLQAVAGIKEHYSRDELVGKQVAVVVNLKPATIKGIRSECMLLAAEANNVLALVGPERQVDPGAKIS
ncbi:MAG: methionine--tRNA ligase [Candidatus Bipolaricaulota bacterium]